MRLKRHKICVDDFELLTIIGRGAFGEVGIDEFLEIHNLILMLYVLIYLVLEAMLVHFSLDTWVPNVFVFFIYLSCKLLNYRFVYVGRKNLATFMQ